MLKWLGHIKRRYVRSWEEKEKGEIKLEIGVWSEKYFGVDLIMQDGERHIWGRLNRSDVLYRDDMLSVA